MPACWPCVSASASTKPDDLLAAPLARRWQAATSGGLDSLPPGAPDPAPELPPTPRSASGSVSLRPVPGQRPGPDSGGSLRPSPRPLPCRGDPHRRKPEASWPESQLLSLSSERRELTCSLIGLAVKLGLVAVTGVSLVPPGGRLPAADGTPGRDRCGARAGERQARPRPGSASTTCSRWRASSA